MKIAGALLMLNHFNYLLTHFKHLLFLLQRNSSNPSVDWHMLLVVLVLLLHVTDESVDRTNTEPANPYRCKTILGKRIVNRFTTYRRHKKVIYFYLYFLTFT